MPYLLDGNNLIGRVRKSSRPSEEDRQALVAELAERLRRTNARAVLFFDGPAGGRGGSFGGLTIRATTGASADDAIVREIERARAPGEIIVVTGDRGLAARCRNAGAKVSAPAEFFARFGASAPRSGEAPRAGESRSAAPVDVEDWLKYFEDPGNRET